MKILKKIKILFGKQPSEAEITEIKKLLEVSDIKVNGTANFKVSYKGSTVPFWLEILPGAGQEVIDAEIQEALSIIAEKLAAGKNLVEISQALKHN